MTSISRLLLGAVAGFGLFAGAASTLAHDRGTDGLCELRLTPIPGGTRLEAYLSPRAGMSGSYAVKVRDSGHGGSATIDQSGDFNAAAGDDLVLSEIELSTSARRLDAEFKLRSGGTTYVCPLRIVPTSL